MNSIAINTSQNVNLDFAIASIGDRILAFIIDLIIKGAYIIFLFILFFQIFNISPVFNTWDNWSISAFIGIVLLPVELYTLLFESLMEGQTPGKRLRKIKVVKIDGYQAHFSDYLMRWFFRLVDIWISTGLVGILAQILSPHNQRLGGMVSGTAVISLKNNVDIDHTILSEIGDSYTPKYQQVLALSDNDMRIIKDNYRIAMMRREYQVIDTLAEKIRTTTGIPDLRPEMNNVAFIELVIKDFNYYTALER